MYLKRNFKLVYLAIIEDATLALYLAIFNSTLNFLSFTAYILGLQKLKYHLIKELYSKYHVNRLNNIKKVMKYQYFSVSFTILGI